MCVAETGSSVVLKLFTDTFSVDVNLQVGLQCFGSICGYLIFLCLSLVVMLKVLIVFKLFKPGTT